MVNFLTLFFRSRIGDFGKMQLKIRLTAEEIESICKITFLLKYQYNFQNNLLNTLPQSFHMIAKLFYNGNARNDQD